MKWKLESALAETEAGHSHAAMGYDREALKHLQEAARRVDRILQDDGSHYDLHNFRTQLTDCISRLAVGYQRLERLDRAIALQRIACEQNEQIGQSELGQLRTADSHAVLSKLLKDAGQAAEAEAEFALAIETLRQLVGSSSHPQQYQAKLQQWQLQLASAE
jgi:tetratricopeptide (TPR) repeat protein